MENIFLEKKHVKLAHGQNFAPKIFLSYYIKDNIFPIARLYKKDPHNHYMWIKIVEINNKKTYIEICYFTP